MKKELFLLVVIFSSVMILSANGSQDDDNELYHNRGSYGGMMGGMGYKDADSEEFFKERKEQMDKYLESLEVLSITGALSLINGEMPTIESDGVKYYVMAPWQQIQNLELKNGMEVTVEGYEMPGPPMNWDGSEKSIMVIKAVINGEEVVVEHDPGTYNMMGGYAQGYQSGQERSGGVQYNSRMKGRRY